MASEGLTEVDFTCPVCFDFFVNPVLLPCSHSICSDCIKAFWESRGIQECPMCREISTVNDPTLNLALKNMCEIFQQERSQRSSSGDENVCSAHKEKLNLFCLNDQQPICLVCRDSKLHTDHSFCPIDEAVSNNKDKLKAILEDLREKMGIYDNFKQTLDQTADHNKVQTQETEEKISKEFEELREILRNEEVARITVLREEEKQKSQMIKDKTGKTSKQIVSLRCAMRDVEKQMKADDDSFLQNFKSTLERAQFSLPDPGNVSDLLINTQEYLNDLRLTVVQKIDNTRGDPSVRGGQNFRRGHNSRGGPSVRGDPNSRGGPSVRGDPNSRGGFKGDHTSRGGHNFRGGPSNRGGHNFKEDPSNRGDPSFKEDPSFREDPSFKEGPIYRGGHNFRGGPSNRGDPSFRGGHNFKEDSSNRGDPSFKEDPSFREDPNFKEGPIYRGGHNFRGGPSNRGDPSFRGGHNFKEDPSNRGDPSFKEDPSFRGPTILGETPISEGTTGATVLGERINTEGAGITEGPTITRGPKLQRGRRSSRGAPEGDKYIKIIQISKNMLH
ncbi:tripartite motif-containing protein 49D-like [Labeo rohita]|uniref:tripartite motif-containing protein 49D-like n=1 Tax=Labeo rohita TaxID=84645 RepID=UPI0021E34191|nr:tripartite motif-containing protein 49D-like [Labeo rohita]